MVPVDFDLALDGSSQVHMATLSEGNVLFNRLKTLRHKSVYVAEKKKETIENYEFHVNFLEKVLLS